MWTLWGILVWSFAVALSGALMPGPLLAVTISESPRRGAKTGPLLMVGHGVLEMGLVGGIFLGLAPLLKQRGVSMVVGFAGAAMLLWMAWGMFRALPGLSLRTEGAGAGGRWLPVTGLVMSVTNPYWVLWWVSFGSVYVLRSAEEGVWGVVFFYAGHILADLAWYTAVSTAMAKGKGLLTDKVYRGLTGVCAGMLVVFAGYFFYGAWTL